MTRAAKRQRRAGPKTAPLTPAASFVVVGTYGEKLGHVDGKGRGLYVFRRDPSAPGALVPVPPNGSPALPLDVFANPTYLCHHAGPEGRHFLYVVDERYDRNGTLTAVAFDAVTGACTVINQLECSGKASCHVSVSNDGKRVLVANYATGTCDVFRREADGSVAAGKPIDFDAKAHAGTFPGANAARQERSHPHMCLVAPNWFSDLTHEGGAFLVPDLGADQVYAFALESTVTLSATVPVGRGFGPRHIALHPSRRLAYLVGELSSELCAMAPGQAGQTWRTFGRVRTLPADWSGWQGRPGDDAQSTCAAIAVHPNGRFVYVSNRVVGGEGLVSCFTLCPETGAPVAASLRVVGAGGACPREIRLLRDGRTLLVACQDSGTVSAFSVDPADGSLERCDGGEPLRCPTPVCVVEVDASAPNAADARVAHAGIVDRALGIGSSAYNRTFSTPTNSERFREIARALVAREEFANRERFRAVARALVADGRGILACDEPPHVLPTRMKCCWERLGSAESVCDGAWRQGYRELLFSAEGLSRSVSGIILHDETIRQTFGDGESCCAFLRRHGLIPGIKVDAGFTKRGNAAPGEWHTEGLDGLGARCGEYRRMGARFAKWRAPFCVRCDGGRLVAPSQAVILEECNSLARYAAVCQQNGLMPIVEPDVVMDGDHDVHASAQATRLVLAECFAALARHGVDIEGILIKTNFVRPGVGNKLQHAQSPEAVGAATLAVLAATVPHALPGVVFLSGGMSESFATRSLAAINARLDRPARLGQTALSFSFGRALQHSARKAWRGEAARRGEAQRALVRSAARCSAAARGAPGLDLAADFRREAGSRDGLHVAGGNRY
jgi:fructose-bisphosphate aldolase class I